jgi:hypothetical protein
MQREFANTFFGKCGNWAQSSEKTTDEPRITSITRIAGHRLCRPQMILDLADRIRSDGTMNSQKVGLRVASLLFALFALGHLLRLLKHTHVVLGSHTIPLWISAPIAVIAALLSLWLWKLAK